MAIIKGRHLVVYCTDILCSVADQNVEHSEAGEELRLNRGEK